LTDYKAKVLQKFRIQQQNPITVCFRSSSWNLNF